MTAPDRFMEAARGLLADAVLDAESKGEGLWRKDEDVRVALDLLKFLEEAPKVSEQKLVADVVGELLTYLHTQPDAFEVGGENSNSTLNRHAEAWLLERRK
tara:strand:- start:268 stop:570 length:303 start_codon:yes stop_codon:yes gene_type:complete